MHRTLTALLRSVTFTQVYGEKTAAGVRPSQTKDQFARRTFFSTLSNHDFQQHFDGEATYYFFGTPLVSSEYTLVMIDIDVGKAQGRGTTEGAVEFAEHLKTIWPHLYTEPSTGGAGIHGYILLQKAGVGAPRVNQAIDQLERFLRHEADRVGADIELVEVKGKAPEIGYGRLGEIASVKYGSFGKYPRQASLQDLQYTQVIDWQDLHKVNGRYSVPEVRQTRKTKLHCGSGFTTMPDDFFAQHYENCKQTWLNMTEGEVFKAGKFAVTEEDAATFMVIAQWFNENGNTDDRLSVRTILAFWGDLYDRNLTSRGPNHHRLKVIRDYLSQRGCIDWVDNRYQPPSEDGAGDGVCCKWRLDEDFCRQIEAGGGNVDTNYRGNGRNLVPTMRMIREEAERTREIEFWTYADREMEALFPVAA